MSKFTRMLATKRIQYVRVCKLLKKPSKEEYKTIAKVTAVGLLIIGALGFLISIVIKMIF